jgi:hypothetical protein
VLPDADMSDVCVCVCVCVQRLWHLTSWAVRQCVLTFPLADGRLQEAHLALSTHVLLAPSDREPALATIC